MDTAAQPPSRLHRALGVRGAAVVGLSAMLGTGVFAVWTPAWQLAGRWLVPALLIAAVVAVLNAVSSARLAMVHPESGGSYAYGRLRLNRAAGVLAGISFVVGKSASAAAAALTIGAYLWPGQQRAVAFVAIALALAIDLRGIVASTRVSAVLATIVIAVVVLVVVVGLTSIPATAPSVVPPTDGALAVVGASGLLFVAFAGYARITVLGEEVVDPARTIPRAMAISFAIVLVLYAVVAATITVLASRGVALGPASLSSVAALAGSPAVDLVVRLGAVLGAGAVLVSLIAGMGRTVFAMASHGDAPRGLARVSRRRVPGRAAAAVSLLVVAIAAVGALPWALALSGFSILTYYAVAHLAALTLPPATRPPRVVPVAGLTGCLIVLGSLAAVVLTGGLPGSG